MLKKVGLVFQRGSNMKINFVAKNSENSKGKTVVIVHGLGEHIARYEKFMNLLTNKGYNVIGFDLPGHGKSSGIRGYTSVEQAMDVINSITKSVQKFILFGHSLGGLISVRYAEEHPQRIEKLVLSAPALFVNPSPSQKFLLNSLGAILPFLTVSNGIKTEQLSTNPEAVRRYVEDPLVHDRISVKLGKSILKNVELAFERSKLIDFPTLILYGTKDSVVPPSGAKKLHNLVKTEIKEIEEFEGGYHELFEDLTHSEKFYNRIISWIGEDYDL